MIQSLQCCGLQKKKRLRCWASYQERLYPKKTEGGYDSYTLKSSQGMHRASKLQHRETVLHAVQCFKGVYFCRITTKQGFAVWKPVQQIVKAGIVKRQREMDCLDDTVVLE